MSFVNNSSLELHSADLANFGRSQTISLVSRPKFAKSYESQTENSSVVDSLHESSEKIKSKKPLKSFCYFLLLQKVESPSISSLRDFMILYIQNNSSICGGDFVFARIFGIKTRLESVESQKILASAKDVAQNERSEVSCKDELPTPTKAKPCFLNS